MAETTTSNSPWGGQEPYLRNVFSEAENLAATPRQYFGGPTVAGFSPISEMGMGLSMQHALAGSPYEMAMQQMLGANMNQGQINLGGSAMTAQQLQQGGMAGQNALGRIAGGGANPYLDQMYGAANNAMTNQFQNAVMPGINSTFGAGGRTGSAAHQGAIGQASQALGQQQQNLAANMYGGAYEGDQQRQLSAASQLQQGAMGGVGAMGDMYGRINASQIGAAQLAPSAYGMETNRLDRLQGVGGAVDQQNQRVTDANVDKFNYLRDTPYDNLSWLGNMVGGQNYGGVSRQYTPADPWGMLMGGLSLGIGAAAA